MNSTSPKPILTFTALNWLCKKSHSVPYKNRPFAFRIHTSINNCTTLHTNVYFPKLLTVETEIQK